MIGLGEQRLGQRVEQRAQDRIDPPPKYTAAVKALEALVVREVRDKQLPAISIALVDDQQIVWAAGFGFRDPHAEFTGRNILYQAATIEDTAEQYGCAERTAAIAHSL